MCIFPCFACLIVIVSLLQNDRELCIPLSVVVFFFWGVGVGVGGFGGSNLGGGSNLRRTFDRHVVKSLLLLLLLLS